MLVTFYSLVKPEKVGCSVLNGFIMILSWQYVVKLCGGRLVLYNGQLMLPIQLYGGPGNSDLLPKI